MQSFKYLLEYIKGNKLLILILLICTNIAAIFSTLNPLIIKYAIDIIIKHNKINSNEMIMKFIDNHLSYKTFTQGLILICFIIISFTFIQGLFLYLKDQLATRIAQTTSKRMREKLFKKISYLEYDFHVNSHGGDTIQRCTSDIETVQNFISDQLATLGQILFTVIYVLGIMCILNVKYTLISIILIPFIFLYTLNFFTKMQKIFQENEEIEGRLTNVVQESLTGIRVVRAFAAEKMEIERFNKQNETYRNKGYEIVRLMAKFWPTSDILCLGQYSIAILAGIYLASNKVVTVGTVIAFISYAGMMIWPIRQFGHITASIGQAFVALKRINEILESQSENYSQKGIKPTIAGNIAIKNLTFQYPNGNQVLDGISLNIKKGQTIAFMGPTGCGKSTVAHILLRLYEYSQGSIKIDGNELSAIDRKWIRENISIVLQEPYLFSRNIYENIKIGKDAANADEIMNVSQVSHIHGSIEKFKDGYKTMVGEKGITLSGGQRQRIAIARALIKKSPILIFDDSLSALDSETDGKIRAALKKDNARRTTIIISHRITSVLEADTIYILNDGKIVEQGNHFDLIKIAKGYYRKIYDIQSKVSV